MKGKKRIIILAVLGALSFAASYLVSGWLSGRKAEPAPQAPGGQAQQGPLEIGEVPTPTSVQPVTISMKERELDRLAKELRLKISVYNAKQRELEKQQQRIQLAEGLLAKHAKELETLRMQLVAPLTRLREAKAALEEDRRVIATIDKANLKHIALIFEKDPEIGGEILAGMCKNKQEEDDAAKILFYMSERAAAKLLAEIPDKDLAAGLCQKLKKVQEEGKKIQEEG